MDGPSLLVGFALGILTAAFSGSLEFILTGGTSGLIPLIAGTVGTVLSYPFLYLFLPKRWKADIRKAVLNKLHRIWFRWIPWPRPDDLFEHLSCVRTACLCAGARHHDRSLADPLVVEWVERLCNSHPQASARMINKQTTLALGEWFEIVRTICDQRNEPLPMHFLRIQRALISAAR